MASLCISSCPEDQPAAPFQLLMLGCGSMEQTRPLATSALPGCLGSGGSLSPGRVPAGMTPWLRDTAALSAQSVPCLALLLAAQRGCARLIPEWEAWSSVYQHSCLLLTFCRGGAVWAPSCGAGGQRVPGTVHSSCFPYNLPCQPIQWLQD